MSALIMGIPGVGELRPGSHVCALYSGVAERDRLLLLFMQAGRRNGDRCARLEDGLAPPRTRLRGYEWQPSDADPCTVPRRPSVQSLRVLRAVGEMLWLPGQLGADQVLVYESAVTALIAEQPTVFLCLHDLNHLGASMLVSVLKIHSAVIVDGAVLDNRHMLVPTHQPQPGLSTALTVAEVRVAELVASGMSNRATAAELYVSPHTVEAHLKHIYLKLDIHSRVQLAVLLLQNDASLD